MKEQRSQTKILYLHGLESRLSEVKHAVLNSYGEVLFPDIDYKATDQIIQNLHTQYRGEKIDVIIGSSFGGFVGYYLSLLLNTHCLVFNPALPYRSFPQQIPAVPQREKHLLTVIGLQDPIIKAADNLDFLLNHHSENELSRIHVLQGLAHQIPLQVFSTEVNYLFNTILLNPFN